MLNESDYFAMYLAKIKSDEMSAFFKNEDLKKKIKLNNSKQRNAIITHILEGTGNVLLSAGNRLLEIA